MNKPAPPHKTETQSISFRVDTGKVDALERLAKATDRPRSWHIEQALDAYLDLQAWQVAEIEKSIAELNAGENVPHEEIRMEFLNAPRSGSGSKTKSGT